MGKVTFKFDDMEEPNEINVIVNRHKLISALYELQNYRRSLYKGYETKAIIIKDNEIVIDDKGNKLKDYDIEDAYSVLKIEDIINRLDDILYDVNNIIE